MRRGATAFKSIFAAPLRAPWWLSAIIAIETAVLLDLISSWLGSGAGSGTPSQLMPVLHYLLPGVFTLAAVASLVNRHARSRPAPAAPPAAASEPLTPLTFELLASMEWYRFGQLCAGYLKAIGIRAEHTGFDGDCNVDLALYRDGEDTPFARARCSSGTGRVGVIPIRDLLGAMAAQQIGHGMHFSLSGYTPDAAAFARARQVALVPGEDLVARINRLPSSLQQPLLRDATRGDYTTPTCPRCGVKMTDRHSRDPHMPSRPLWGCVNYPHCQQTLPRHRK